MRSFLKNTQSVFLAYPCKFAHHLVVIFFFFLVYSGIKSDFLMTVVATASGTSWVTDRHFLGQQRKIELGGHWGFLDLFSHSSKDDMTVINLLRFFPPHLFPQPSKY